MLSEKEIALRMTNDVTSFRDKLSSFVDTMHRSLTQATSEHHQEEKGSEAILQDLTDRENGLRDQATELNKSYEIARVKAASAMAGKSRLEAELKILPKTFDALERRLREAEHNLKQHQGGIDDKREAIRKKRELLSQALQFFNSRLGLYFERKSPDDSGFRLKATFTHLGADFDQQASFCIDIDGGSYVVFGCDPDIACDEIVQRFQRTDDISYFFQAMRGAFQNHFTSLLPTL